ncbi:MAG: hypothetical protein ABSG67_03675 [Thermoguttaceae bacterium]|jgi:hypothetical protein
MQEILFDYKLNPTTWAYLSSLLMIGMYFKFHRFWSVRNLDLVALIGISPGLLLIYYGLANHAPGQVQGGYVWLFGISGFFLIRLLIDPIMVRRPLLEPNLSVSGLTFTGVALLIFLMANIVKNPPERLESYLAKQAAPAQDSPGLKFFYQFAGFSSKAMIPVDGTQPEVFRRQEIRVASARSTAILGHLAVIIGMVLVGYRHFDNIHTGVAAATLYLLTFYTSQMTGQVDHVVPAALLVWAVVAYRRPMIAGVFMGIAVSVIYYPWFLLPLWCGFYWRKGVVRFLIGVVLALAIMITWLALSTGTWETFWPQLRLMLGFRNPLEVVSSGFWTFHEKAFRYPVLAAFVALCCSLALWPPQKNLGTLLSCSAAVMLATQFWHANNGGLYIAWYLPLLILTIFRPNLEDRVALTAVRDIRWPWRRNRAGKAQSAAPTA